MSLTDLLGAIVAFLFVLGLLGALFLLLRRAQEAGMPWLTTAGRGPRRLKVQESLMLDPRHRLVLVRRDDREHLLLLGPGQDLLVESLQAERGDEA